MPPSVNATLLLRSGGVSLLLDVTDGQLPAVRHWGADLGELTVEDTSELIRSAVPHVGPNEVDDPIRVAVLPEHWTGWTGRPGLTGSRAGGSWTPRFTSVALRIDGQDAPAGPEPAFHTVGAGVVEVDAVDQAAQLELSLRFELFAGGLLRARARVRNRAEAVYQVDDLVLAFPVPTVASEILDLAGRWGKERAPQRRELTVGTHLREGRKGRTGADAATVLHVGVPGFGFTDGEVWAVHTGWSGNHTHYAERVFTGAQVVGGGELLLPGEIRLEQDAEYTTPWLYASYGVGLDEVAQRFHRYLRSRPGHPDARRPVTLNVWEAVYFEHDLDRLLDLAERAAALGVERYVLDDGWFGSRRNDFVGLGDWTVSEQAWPDGLHPLVDRVTELGMEFGLWFEPEMVNEDSDLARAHPEWIMAPLGRLPIQSRHQQVLNLGIPECYQHIREAISAVLDEYAIGYIKWDHNRDLIDAGTQPDGRPGVHRQTEALYRMLAELRARHPRLEIESCASGGARVDLGVLQHTQRVWVSDCIDPLERQQMHRWTGQLIPPEMMGAHIASGRSHTTGRIHDLAFRAGTAVFGHLGIEWDLAAASDAELAELRTWIAFYREHRETLLTGDVVRADFPDPAWSVHGVVAPDRSRAIYGLALLQRPAVTSPLRLRLPGLDPVRPYRVEPVLVGSGPRGLVPPQWWGVRLQGPDEPDYGHQQAPTLVTSGKLGTVQTGRVLAQVGLMAPLMDPEQIVLYRVTALTG